jgi:ribosomal protein L11 methyltransferase
MSWVEVRFQANPEAVDWVRTLLANAHYTGEVWVTNADLSDPKFPLVMQLYFANEGSIHQQLDRLETQLSSLQRTGQISQWETAIATENPNEDTNASLIHRVGDRFVILPADPRIELAAIERSAIELAATDLPIKLPETLAFGSGLHPATQLSLSLIERHVVPGLKVLDLGCGSGVLSVAIARLGSSVLAVDNDPIAVAATEVAIALNGVNHVTVQRGSLGRGAEMGHWMGGDGVESVAAIELEDGSDLGFDLIVANVLGRMHLSLINDYRMALTLRLQQLQEAGQEALAKVIVAGFTVDYEPELDAAFNEAGFRRMDEQRLEDWVAIAYQLAV